MQRIITSNSRNCFRPFAYRPTCMLPLTSLCPLPTTTTYSPLPLHSRYRGSAPTACRLHPPSSSPDLASLCHLCLASRLHVYEFVRCSALFLLVLPASPACSSVVWLCLLRFLAATSAFPLAPCSSQALPSSLRLHASWLFSFAWLSSCFRWVFAFPVPVAACTLRHAFGSLAWPFLVSLCRLAADCLPPPTLLAFPSM